MTLLVRAERPGDEDAIRALTAAAFAGRPYSDGSEPRIVDALRAAGDLALSLLATIDGAIVGHVAFSPVSIENCERRWYGLGPVSAQPDLQGQGIGSRLIEAGIAELHGRGAAGIVVLGNPAYYGRFGFAHDPALRYPGPPPEYFQRLVLEGDPPIGVVTYSPAFG